MMKKFQSFEEIINYLGTEEIPFTDNKQNILKEINTNFISKKILYRKPFIVCAVLFTLVISVAFTFGYIKEHEEFVKAHSGEITGKLTDDRGNIVIQIGTVGDAENYKSRMQESNQREIVSKEFKNIAQSLEDNLPDDKIAVFIPVKDLEKFIDFSILNWCENYYTIEDMKNNVPDCRLIPRYIPDGFAFRESNVYFDYENYYEPYEEAMTHNEFLIKLFEEAKEGKKDYYYKEYDRSDSVTRYILEYEDSEKVQKLYINFKKGKTTVLCDSDKDEFSPGIIEHNGRKYLKDDGSYYTYLYIEDELWTVNTSTILEENEIFRIIESISEIPA